MKQKINFKLLCFSLCSLIFTSFIAIADVTVKQTGELKKWHAVTLTFDGPEANETDDDNPFINYRLNVEFTHLKTNKRYLIPGYFAADGNAANTGAISGNKWRVHFSPDETGDWRWNASFKKDRFIAVSRKTLPGRTAGFMDRQKGLITIKNTDKKHPDFRSKGRLKYVDEAYLRFEENGEYFIKSGPDSPENLLSFADFDGTFHNDGHKDDLVKTWQAHLKHWQKGDPAWKKNKGKALVGAINYIADKGMNSISFLTLSLGGDDDNVFPYVDYTTYDRFDVSKLDQWNIIFSHAQSLGLFLHFKTQEVENQGLLDNGGLGLHRQLYYRELIARFGHHLALNWNMAEESGEWHTNHPTMPQSTIQRLAMAKYFEINDPYNHHVVIHNGNFFEDITKDDSAYTGVSLQTSRKNYAGVHPEVKRIRSWPVTNGRPLAVSVDEPGHHKYNLPPDSIDPEHNDARMNALWGAYMAGAWGVEWYFGYGYEHSDLNAESWETRDLFWDQVKHALDFFRLIDVEYQKATSMDNLVVNQADDNAWVLAQPGEFYIVYIKDASKELELKMQLGIGKYSIKWFDPRNGGKLIKGTKEEISIDRKPKNVWERENVKIGMPSNNTNKDWAVLIKRL